MCTLGIKPSFPNSGFGYIEFNKKDTAHIKKVNQFREKPDYDTAKEFLTQGNFLWNAGIFMWSVKTITAAFKNYQPSQFELFKKGLSVLNTAQESKFIADNYPKAENISIDYAILENSSAIYVLEATFDWNDLGTWGSLYDKLEKDADNNAVVNAKVLSQESGGNMIRSKAGKIVVVDGLTDYIIVDKEDVLLIYPKSKEQDIKQVLKKVKDTFGDEYA